MCMGVMPYLALCVCVCVCVCVRVCTCVHVCAYVYTCVCTYTVFIRIVAMATINFSLAGVWLLVEGGSYSRTAFINSRAIPPGAIHK